MSTNKWTEVFTGPAWKAELLRGELEERGIPTFTPDTNIQTIDPFIRTGQVFDLHLLVPGDRVDEALEVIGAGAADAEPSGDALADDAATPVDNELTRLEGIARRIRWSAIVGMFAPYGLWLAMSYFPAVRDQRLRPRSHGYTIFATAICSIWTLLIVALLCFVMLGVVLSLEQ